jgi:hypothetical protein
MNLTCIQLTSKYVYNQSQMGTAEPHATLRTGHKTRETKKDEKHGPHQETVVEPRKN